MRLQQGPTQQLSSSVLALGFPCRRDPSREGLLSVFLSFFHRRASPALLRGCPGVIGRSLRCLPTQLPITAAPRGGSKGSTRSSSPTPGFPAPHGVGSPVRRRPGKPANFLSRGSGVRRRRLPLEQDLRNREALSRICLEDQVVGLDPAEAGPAAATPTLSAAAGAARPRAGLILSRGRSPPPPWSRETLEAPPPCPGKPVIRWQEPSLRSAPFRPSPGRGSSVTLAAAAAAATREGGSGKQAAFHLLPARQLALLYPSPPRQRNSHGTRNPTQGQPSGLKRPAGSLGGWPRTSGGSTVRPTVELV